MAASPPIPAMSVSADAAKARRMKLSSAFSELNVGPGSKSMPRRAAFSAVAVAE
jgi:hypothetical protein